MRGFGMSDGDLAIVNGEIPLVTGSDLKTQTIQSVLSTNKGEWLFNKDEGINFDNVFSKQPLETKKDIMRNEVEDGVLQVDETLNIDDFNCDFDNETRVLKVDFAATESSGETLTISTEY